MRRDTDVRQDEQEEDVREGSEGALFGRERADEFRARWTNVQAQFVDDPRAAVKAADALVGDVLGDLSRLFTDERDRVTADLAKRERADTEDLRVAIRRYRSFFERLLAV